MFVALPFKIIEKERDMNIKQNKFKTFAFHSHLIRFSTIIFFVTFSLVCSFPTYLKCRTHVGSPVYIGDLGKESGMRDAVDLPLPTHAECRTKSCNWLVHGP